MGKPEVEKKPNKVHKTLRDKLRKRRQQLKQHKKQKRIKHIQFDTAGKKLKFYQQNQNKKLKQDGIKQNKLRKHIEKFINIYEDDLEDFYQLFKNFDEGGTIDIQNVDSPKMQKCLKKLFRHLPLKKKKYQYSKKQKYTGKLETIMKTLVSEHIQNYLENGTDQGSQRSSSDDQGGQRMKDQSKKSVKVKLESGQLKKQQKKPETQRQKIQQLQSGLRLYKNQIEQQRQQPSQSMAFGPMIPTQQRQKLAQMFQKQINQKVIGPVFTNQQKQQYQQNQQLNDDNRLQTQLGNIFGLNEQKVNKKAKRNIDEIPEQLLAEGSAKIGQKQQIDANQMEEYNKIHRPKKLIEEHQEMMNINTDPNDSKKRKPFNRERDIVNGGKTYNGANNGVFFDFKDKMTKPKQTNSFL